MSRAEIKGEPQPEVKWLKEGMALQMTNRHSATYDVHTGVCSFVLKDCQQSDAGVYTCYAQNVHSHITCTANVDVISALFFSHLFD